MSIEPAFTLDVRDLVRRAKQELRRHVGGTTVSISVTPDDVEKRVAREIVVRLVDRRVLSAQECCDNCIDQALTSIQEVRRILVDKQVELSRLPDGPLYLSIEFMLQGIRQFLTFEQRLRGQVLRQDYGDYKALALQPNDAITLSNLGTMLKLAGRYEEALEVQQRTVRLDPFHPPNYLERLADAYAGVGNYIQCVEVAERGVALDPNYVGLHGSLALCYAALGRDEEAKAATAEILRTNPRFTLKAFAAYVPYTHERDLQRSLNLLRKAGVPE